MLVRAWNSTWKLRHEFKVILDCVWAQEQPGPRGPCLERPEKGLGGVDGSAMMNIGSSIVSCAWILDFQLLWTRKGLWETNQRGNLSLKEVSHFCISPAFDLRLILVRPPKIVMGVTVLKLLVLIYNWPCWINSCLHFPFVSLGNLLRIGGWTWLVRALGAQALTLTTSAACS